MSTTYHLVCDTCKVRLWIGQRGSENITPRIYTDKKYLDALNNFLTSHVDHILRYLPDYEAFDLGYRNLDDYEQIAKV